MGLLDLPSPLFGFIDAALSFALPAAGIRVAAYGMLSGLLSMAIYRRVSRQDELADLAAASRRLRHELSRYDGPFQGLKERAWRLMRLNGRHLRLSFVPAVLASLPLLFLMPWLSNQFGLQAPDPTVPVLARARGLESDFESLQWRPPALTSDSDIQVWHIAWPEAGKHADLMLDGEVLLRLDTEPLAPVVHRKVPVWNHLVGNPAGYLDAGAPLFAVELDLPKMRLHRIGPAWLQGWPAVYLIPLIAISLVLRQVWRLN